MIFMLCSMAMSAISSSSFLDKTAPVGLFGVLMIMQRVFLVMALLRSSGTTLKPFSMLVFTSTRTPPESLTAAAWVTKKGEGTITSSPSLMNVDRISRKAWFPPSVTMMFLSGSASMPFSRLSFSDIASLKILIPLFGV